MEEIDLRELIGMFLEKKLLIIFVVILFAILGVVYTTRFITPLYESSTSLVLVQTGDNDAAIGISDSITTTDITLNSKLVEAYSVVAKSKRVANKVLENLNQDMTLERLTSYVTISSANDTQNLKVTVRHENPEEACKIANEYAEVFIEEVTEIYKVNNLYILDSAEVDPEPCNINIVKNVLIFSFIGGILVAGYILLINMLDTTIKSDADIEKVVNLPVLATIIFVEENSKKKSKKNLKNKKTKKNKDSFESSVQYYYDNNLRSTKNDFDDSDSLFSYTNRNDFDESLTNFRGHPKRDMKNNLKGGK